MLPICEVSKKSKELTVKLKNSVDKYTVLMYNTSSVKRFALQNILQSRKGSEINMEKGLEISLLLDFYGDMLTEKQREAIENYYNNDLSLGEIANNLGITRQGVRDAIKKSETILFNLEDKLGLAKKFTEMQKGVEKIVECAERIDYYNRRLFRSKDVQDSIATIMETAQSLCD